MLELLMATTGKAREISVTESALFALLGFAIVFVGIAFLILIVWLVGKVMSRTTATVLERKSNSRETQSAIKSQENDEDEVSEETVAVITAAVMAYYQSTNAKCDFTVKRIKRI